MLPLAESRTPPGTPPPPIVSQRHPLGLCDRPRIPSPKTARVSENELSLAMIFAKQRRNGKLLDSSAVRKLPTRLWKSTDMESRWRKAGNGTTRSRTSWLERFLGILDRGKYNTTAVYRYALSLEKTRRHLPGRERVYAKAMGNREWSRKRKHE